MLSRKVPRSSQFPPQPKSPTYVGGRASPMTTRKPVVKVGGSGPHPNVHRVLNRKSDGGMVDFVGPRKIQDFLRSKIPTSAVDLTTVIKKSVVSISMNLFCMPVTIMGAVKSDAVLFPDKSELPVPSPSKRKGAGA